MKQVLSNLVPEHVSRLGAYVPGKPIEAVERELGVSAIKLASNENPFGPSPRALEAMKRQLASSHRYPDAGGFYLREKGLLVTAGRKQVVGRPILYRTSKEFLLRFGLRDLSELPTLEEFQELARASLEGTEEMMGLGGAAETTPTEPEGPGDGSADAEAASSKPSGAAKSDHA